MKKVTKLFIIGALTLTTTGCFNMPTTEININTGENSEGSATITLEEYNKLKTGMTYEEVKEIVGGECNKGVSQSVGGIKQAIYICDGEDEGAKVTLTFQNDKLTAKVSTDFE